MISFIVASNDDQVLRETLLASPDLKTGVEINIQRECFSAAHAYNRGLKATRGEILVFLHQDVYLPTGWLSKLYEILRLAHTEDSSWGVLGSFGVDKCGAGKGYLYSTGCRGIIGSAFLGIAPVETLDEVLLIVRRSSGLKFDESIGGFHLYGADICLSSSKLGMKNYAISNFCIHNSNGIQLLPAAYWRCFLRIRQKWWDHLPVNTPCMPVTRWGGTVIRYLIKSTLMQLLRPKDIGLRTSRPEDIYRSLKLPS